MLINYIFEFYRRKKIIINWVIKNWYIRVIINVSSMYVYYLRNVGNVYESYFKYCYVLFNRIVV